MTDAEDTEVSSQHTYTFLVTCMAIGCLLNCTLDISRVAIEDRKSQCCAVQVEVCEPQDAAYKYEPLMQMLYQTMQMLYQTKKSCVRIGRSDVRRRMPL